jgi:hypothetical protein
MNQETIKSEFILIVIDKKCDYLVFVMTVILKKKFYIIFFILLKNIYVIEMFFK